MEKISVYFMPGLAASPKIFEYIKLSEEQFEMYFLEWILPISKESLNSYAHRICEQIKHQNPVLIGVSFGGILVQEMATIIDVKKTIIISSVKSNQEFPQRIKIAKIIKIYKFLPYSWVENFENFEKYAIGKTLKQRFSLYKKYLSVNKATYLSWAVKNLILWERTELDENVIHIHGTNDRVFPIQNIKNCIKIQDGTHIMILDKSKWFNENLGNLILDRFYMN
jgi:pimeloyl-ACP methyl ester carboxylesterase